MKMKLYKSLLMAVLSAFVSGVFASCDDDLAEPPMHEMLPDSPWQANTSILDFKTKYYQSDRNYAALVGLTDSGDSLIIGGRVIANDETSNIYQKVVIQDETAAVQIYVNSKTLYSKFKIGEEAYINVTGLYAGASNGSFQIGTLGDYNGTPETDRLEEEVFESHSAVKGLPHVETVDTITGYSISDILSWSTTEQIIRYESQLIRLDDVEFSGGGSEKFADPDNVTGGATNRDLTDTSGKTLTVRNSIYSTFAEEIMPGGTGSVVGILSRYGSGWQFFIRSPKDCFGFSGSSISEVGDPTATITELKTKYWTTDRNSCAEILPDTDDGRVIVKGRVISTDEAQSIYKVIYISDGTEALAFAIDGSRLYNTYPLGQELVIDVTNLNIGNYNGLMQVGSESEYNGAPSIGRMSSSTFKSRTRFVGSPDVSAVVPVNVTLAELSAALSSESDKRHLQSQLVKISGVHFQDGGTATWVVGDAATNSTLLDDVGNSIIVRTSMYAPYKDELLPAGTGSVTAILSYYGTAWQLLMNSLDGCEDFDGVNPTPTPSESQFRKVSAITSGKSYLIVASGKAAKPNSGNYGYLSVDDVTDQNGVIAASDVNAFTFNAVSGGYTIVDSNGKYLYQTGTYNSFNFSTSAEDGSVWSVEAQSDGSFKITNTSVNKYIQYSTQYGSYGSYATESGVMPSLYEKIN